MDKKTQREKRKKTKKNQKTLTGNNASKDVYFCLLACFHNYNSRSSCICGNELKRGERSKDRDNRDVDNDDDDNSNEVMDENEEPLDQTEEKRRERKTKKNQKKLTGNNNVSEDAFFAAC